MGNPAKEIEREQEKQEQAFRRAYRQAWREKHTPEEVQIAKNRSVWDSDAET